ncbi:glycosyltransferase family 2 protein [Bacteroides helcogenes]|uniref:Glycosyl transferase family 2 n=1 Tax=Bacteroides helcogenes (strain ATCC 35417 / DSM 20613 / JCM 6297 / CCUG 15421 / P 36-108) TaxID=693979 RepID=E6SQT3_BACT6|nr:glycosyltransferase family 2 protein [Bacteroides helcogenes]ADV44016.1 glycosyl transferase family 2 [Bacteroides helcogenes P 36-108]MDY5237840.1 glycosyltransferase family 2 protein [Bacteroides helcogenes]
MTALISIITINHNGLHDTCEMIDSFRKYETYPHYEIIVVDNGSHLPEAEEIRHKYPCIKVVQNINNGFAGGNNAGLKAAEGAYLFFINNDTVIKEPILDTLVQRIEADPQRNGGVSPMLKFAAQPDTLQYAGFTPLSPVTLRNESIGFMQKDAPCFHVACETASLHGAAMMVSRKALQDAGPMTEVYFLFYEELDWSVQIKKAGYRLWYEPAAVVYHKESMTARKGTPLREFYLSRARMLFARRNLSGTGKLLSCLYILTLAAPKKALTYLLHGEAALAKAAISGTWSGICMRLIPQSSV